MKKSIALFALLIITSASIFASVPAKKVTKSVKNEINVQPLRKDLRVGVSVDRSEKGKSFLTIKDKNKNVVFEDFLTSKLAVEKAYNISQLEVGDYTITVKSNDLVVEKTIHIYEADGQKTYFFFE
jgi:hypothetical protein